MIGEQRNGILPFFTLIVFPFPGIMTNKNDDIPASFPMSFERVVLFIQLNLHQSSILECTRHSYAKIHYTYKRGKYPKIYFLEENYYSKSVLVFTMKVYGFFYYITGQSQKHRLLQSDGA